MFHKRPASASSSLTLSALLLTLGSVAGACAAPQTTSLLGEPLYPPELEEAAFSKRTKELSAARASFQSEPSESSTIWYGRRLAYLGRYLEAIEVFTTGLERYPHSYRLRRHRGHRYLSLRRFSEALADFTRAAELSEHVADELEPDGMPNKQGLPRSSTHSNIYYHLGLVQYLMGDFEASRQSYERCLTYSKNDDMQCASRYWLYLNLRRQKRDDDAARVLEPVRSDMDVIENFGYQNLLLLFKGEKPIGEVLPADSDGTISATVAYGVSMWHYTNGREELAREMWRELVAGSAWPAFGFIAAEAELAR